MSVQINSTTFPVNSFVRLMLNGGGYETNQVLGYESDSILLKGDYSGVREIAYNRLYVGSVAVPVGFGLVYSLQII